jgi:hypothetical protein
MQLATALPKKKYSILTGAIARSDLKRKGFSNFVDLERFQ